MTPPRVAIVGGGLAGLAAALRLAERGCRVTVYDAAARLGGKAGADSHANSCVDHGYHVFPPWYVNVWRLIDDLGIRDRLHDCDRFHLLRRDQFPRVATVERPGELRNLWRNIRSGLGPFLETVLYFYSVVDLASQPYRVRSYLDRITVNAFVRSRFYRTEWLAKRLGADILRATSITSYLVSAMTVRNVFRYWIRYPAPMTSIFDRDLQTGLIQPLAERLVALGVEIRLAHRLDRIELLGSRVTALHLCDTSTATARRVEVERAILAVPPEVLVRFVDEELFRAAPKLANVRYLQSAPMAMLTLTLKSRIPHIPREHVFLEESKYQITFLDLAWAWTGLRTSVLSVVAADYAPLISLSETVAVDEIVREIGRYVPEVYPDNIADVVFAPHIDTPLCLNTVGSWQWRPTARTGIENMYVAGDYCRAQVDIVSMESAVESGLAAAEALRADDALAPPIEVAQPAIPPRWQLVLVRVALLPFIACVRLALAITARSHQESQTG